MSQQDLTSANAVRMARAQYRRDVRAGRVDPIKIIQDPPEVMCGMQILKFLTAVPGIQAYNALKLCDEVDLNPATEMGSIPITKALVLGKHVVRRSRRYNRTPTTVR